MSPRMKSEREGHTDGDFGCETEFSIAEVIGHVMLISINIGCTRLDVLIANRLEVCNYISVSCLPIAL